MRRKPNKVSMEKLYAAAERNDGTGFCLECGTKHSGVEPDARNYECKKCLCAKVYGASEILLMCI